MTKVTVLHTAEAEVPGPEGKPQTYTYITYKDEEGRIGMVTIPKKDPSDADIAMAIRKQREEEKRQKPREVGL